jgi:hypothetical protein
MATPANLNKWYLGHVTPCWAGHRNLPYANEQFNDPESVSYWKNLGYNQTKFTGDMYDMRQSAPEWMPQVLTNFDWKHTSWSVYCMSPGVVLPNHRDTYARFRQLHNIADPDTIWRAVIFLEDWQSGHYLEIDRTPVTQWAAGDMVAWQNDVPHLAANIGISDRYTLQITGVRIENSQS